MLKISTNINHDRLKEQIEAKENVYLPNPTSSVIKNRPSFYTDYLAKEITLVPKKIFIDKLAKDYDVLLPFSPQTLCMMCILEHRQEKGSYAYFPREAGFDMKFLPDIPYMLMLLATQTIGSHQVITKLPPLANKLSKEWQAIVNENALDHVMTTGTVKAQPKLDLSGLEDYLLKIQDTAKSYYLMKFKLTDMTKRLLALQKLSKDNDDIRDLMVHFKPEKAIQSLGQKMAITNDKKTQNAPTVTVIPIDKKTQNAPTVTVTVKTKQTPIDDHKMETE